ncbi:Uncharacterised protein [Mycobacterium tuberculosis]|nr:exonuclease V subunit beta RecB [Mycobacterium tuberculosis variant africanum]CKS98705.1 Uncharacterised protein [Mycobacterium tuberculosis]
MARRSVIPLPPPQKAVQHNNIQQRLQWVVRMQHGLGQPLEAVIGGGVTKVIGLVIDHQISLPG